MLPEDQFGISTTPNNDLDESIQQDPPTEITSTNEQPFQRDRQSSLASTANSSNNNSDNDSGGINTNASAQPQGASRVMGQPIPRISLRANVLSARAQLFDAFFRRVAIAYAHVFPSTARRIIEFGFLIQAFFVLAVFIHLHLMFVRSPITCLDKLRTRWPVEAESDPLFSATDPRPDGMPPAIENKPVKRNHYAPGDPLTPREPWPEYGVLRVEVIRNPNPKYSLADSYAKQFYGSNMDYTEDLDDLVLDPSDQGTLGSYDVGASTNGASSTKYRATTGSPNAVHYPFFSRHKVILQESGQLLHSLRSLPRHVYAYLRDTVELVLRTFSSLASTKTAASAIGAQPIQPTELPIQFSVWSFNYIKHNILCAALTQVASLVNSLSSSAVQFCRDIPLWLQNLYGPVHTEENYIIEYALEYGFLRLSPAMRKRLNISVKLVVLDPEKDACFGGFLSRFLMEEFLGYEDLLLGSIKHLAVSESVKGHMANVVTGQHYRLVSSQMSRSSYLVATLVMLLFTFCVSVLLRYSSHQLLVVVADILQVFETNVAVGIPATPFMTVILALVAIETIMSEFFGDSFTAFYVIFIVSICDHYEAVFCRTEISRRYWPRFFYLYHFAFYAYHYRFNGQFSGMALWVSWLFILHSMIYFFHHYELPNFLSDWEVRDLLQHINPGRGLIESVQIEVGPTWPAPDQQPNSDSIASASTDHDGPGDDRIESVVTVESAFGLSVSIRRDQHASVQSDTSVDRHHSATSGSLSNEAEDCGPEISGQSEPPLVVPGEGDCSPVISS